MQQSQAVVCLNKLWFSFALIYTIFTYVGTIKTRLNSTHALFKFEVIKWYTYIPVGVHTQFSFLDFI